MHRLGLVVTLALLGCGTSTSTEHPVDGAIDGAAHSDGALHVDAAIVDGHVSPDATISTPGCPAGIVGWWTGDGTIADKTGADPLTWCAYSGTPGDGSCAVTTPAYVPGKVGQAFSFDGNRFVRSLDFELTSGSFTVDLWVKWSSTTQPEWSCALAASEAFTFDNLLQTFQIDSDGSGGVRVQAGNDGIHVPFGAVSTSAFQHLAFVYNGSTVTTYLNGTKVQAMAWTSVLQIQSLKFGMNRTYDSPFRGAVDEVHVFDRALDASEIAGIYATGSAGICH